MLESVPIGYRLSTLNPKDSHLLCAVLRGCWIALSSFWLSSLWLSSFWLSSLWLSSFWLSSLWLSSLWLSSFWLSSFWLSSLLIRGICIHIALIYRPSTCAKEKDESSKKGS